ncbi:MAG: ABC transporter permease [Parachlamydiales bacterium]|jgi:peptide/nickel transport system permease protein
MNPNENIASTYWQTIWKQFNKHITGKIGLLIIALFTLVGIYAPFLASSKPLIVQYEGGWYFPLFKYLFFTGFYTKHLDIFFNLLIFTFPFYILALLLFHKTKKAINLSTVIFSVIQCSLFLYLIAYPVKDPASDPSLTLARRTALKGKSVEPTWAFDTQWMNDYAKLNLVLRYKLRQQQHEKLQSLLKTDQKLATLWQTDYDNEQRIVERLKAQGNTEALKWYTDRQAWLEQQSQKINFMVMPLIRDFHWEDDAGGDSTLNHLLPFYELTRINRKDFLSALIFGVRVSLVVGIIAVAISLAIGIPVGAAAGYFGGTADIIISRFLEIWEAMPSFLMLLMIVAIAQSKSIFLVISVIGLFGWTGFSRYIRAEFLKQRNLSYVEACHSLGFGNSRIIFGHILPNAIPPLLTLLPFAVMGAVSSEAGLSFLGLGEEGSCSWGVLMDEGRSVFPGESYLLWPPALLLTILLIATALVGDALRDAFDPKMHR